MSDATLFSSNNAIVAAITLAIVLIAVFLHYEVLYTLYRRLPALGDVRAAA